MSMVIGTNISSLTAQRHLASSKGDMDQAMERLASGSRINSSQDDAAGLAIAGRMTSQINGLNQAVRNANDGVALAQSAEGALDETTSILQRMRDLSVQASSDTLTSSDRNSIQSEITALTSEIGRIAETTTFNNINLLDGSAKSLQIQVGAGEGEKVSLTITSASADDLGLNSGVSSSGGLAGGRMESMDNVNGNDISINGLDWIENGDASVSTTGVAVNDAAGNTSTESTSTAAGVAAIINSGTGAHGAVAEATNLVEGKSASGVTDGATDGTGLQINGVYISSSANMEELVININNEATDASARLVDGRLELFNDTGKNIDVAGTLTGTGIVGSGLSVADNVGFLTLSNTDGSKTLVSRGDNAASAIEDVNKLGFNSRTSPSEMTGGSVAGGATDSAIAGNLQATDDLTINGISIGPSSSNGAPSAGVLAAHLNTFTSDTKVTASASTKVSFEMITNAIGQMTAAETGFDVNGATVTFAANSVTVAALAETLNTEFSALGSDIVAIAEGGNLVMSSVSGATITTKSNVAQTAGSATATIRGTTTGDGAAVSGHSTAVFHYTGSLSLTNTEGGDIAFGSNTGSEDELLKTLGKLGLHQQGSSDLTAAPGALSMTTSASAAAAVTTIDAALEKIFSNRGDLGAFQNRLEHTISNLRNVSENMSFSKSQIMDTDFATESANLAKAQVLQQAGTAMLAQANASGQSVLSLLK